MFEGPMPKRTVAWEPVSGKQGLADRIGFDGVEVDREFVVSIAYFVSSPSRRDPLVSRVLAGHVNGRAAKPPGISRFPRYS